MKIKNNVRMWRSNTNSRWKYAVTESIVRPGITSTSVLAMSHADYRTRLSAWIAGEKHLVRIKKEQEA